MENRKSFILYTDNYEAIRSLTYEQKGRLLDAAYLYEMGEELPEMDAVTAMAFSFIRIALDRNDEKWEAIKAKRAEAGAKGAAARWGKDGKDSKNGKCHQDMANDGKQWQTMAKMAVNVNDNVNVNVSGSVINKTATATYEERLKSEAVMLQAIANSAATTPQAVIAMLPDFADQLAIDGKKHKNYAEWRKHLQNYILKRKEKQRNNGTDNNKPFEPAGGIDYSRTDF